MITNYQIFNSDCIEQMKSIPDNSIDFILCDLPYGTTKCSWDIIIPFEDLWKQYKRIIKTNGAIALFGQEPFSSTLRLSNIDDYKFDWYWEKERLTNVSQVKRRAGKTIETISMFYSKQPTYNPQMVKHNGPPVSNKPKNGKLGNIIDEGGTKLVKPYVDTGYRYPTQLLHYNRDCLTCNLHETQKPVALLEFLIKTYTNEGETVLDNTMGSGSTGVACLNTHRNFIGIELNIDIFNIAKERLNKHYDFLQLQEE